MNIRLDNLRTNASLQGAFVLLIMLGLFFSNALLHINDHTFSSADIQQNYPATNIDPNYQLYNPLLFDPWQQIEPWLIFSRDTIRTGQIPLWNPYNANGVPHMANYQSAVFSIYSVPFYVLPFKWAALLAAALKLYIIGFFTFLFLKQHGLGLISALSGGTAFMFAGYNIVWLDWSHIGAVTALPMCLYFSELLFKHFDKHSTNKLRWPLIGFSISIAIGLLAGHPETFYFCGLLIGAYTAVRLAALWRKLALNREVRTNWVRLTLYIGMAGSIGVSLAAIQLLPFAEYSANSALDRRDAIWQQHALSITWPLALYPNLLGNPSEPNTLNMLTDSFGNYNEVNGFYAGGALIYLALLGFVFLKRSRYQYLIIFFGAIIFIWLFYAYDLFGIKHIFNLIPGIAQSFSGRSVPVFLFSLSVCAALSLDQILTLDGQGQFPQAILVIGFGCGLAIVSTYGAYQLLNAIGPTFTADLLLHQKLNIQQIILYEDHLLAHIRVIVITCGIAIAALGVLVLKRYERYKPFIGSSVLVVIFIQGGWLLHDYNPVIEDRFFYPTMPTMNVLEQYGQGKSLLFIQDTTLPANVNLPYKLRTTSSNDAIDVKYYDRLENVFFGTIAPTHAVSKFNEIGLKLFGIDAIVTNDVMGYSGMKDSDAYQLVAKTDMIALVAYTKKLAAYHTVVNALIAHSDEEALQFLDTPGFDPAKTVVLNSTQNGLDTLQAAHDEQNPIEILADNSTDIRLKVNGRVQPGYVVLARTYYPGWKAKVNGTPQPVYRANYAFSAIPLQQGDNLVEFYYDPDSFKIGSAISLISLFVLILIASRKQSALS